MSRATCARLITIALPYANGPLHLGHMVEATQADIYARFAQLYGDDVTFVSGSDAHGTAIMLSAEAADIAPEVWVEQMRQAHLSDYEGFLIGFDAFHTTHSPLNQTLSSQIFTALQDKGDMTTRVISQAFDPEKQLFLADRFIKGDCPKCKAPGQHGDNCEVCGATYSPLDLGNPVSALSGATPIEKDSEHVFFKLGRYTDFLRDYIEGGHVQPQVANKLKEWFDDELRDWDISRDAPYFGFEIPGYADKYFYVWLDAPVGYMASFLHACESNDALDFDAYWKPDSDVVLTHFIGKDIVYFHALFWPAMLQGAGYRLPNSIVVHGYLTINGHKMSKSAGTYIKASDYLSQLNPEYFRYYMAARMNAQVEDIDFNFDDFMARINSDLVGKFVNLASRSAGFITKRFDGRLASQLDDDPLVTLCQEKAALIAELYDALDYNRCMREIMALADLANQYIDAKKPWALAKDPDKMNEVQLVCTHGLNAFRIIATYLKPVLPETAKRIEDCLNVTLTWEGITSPLLDHCINPFQPLMQRVTPLQMSALENNDE